MTERLQRKKDSGPVQTGEGHMHVSLYGDSDSFPQLTLNNSVLELV